MRLKTLFVFVACLVLFSGCSIFGMLDQKLNSGSIKGDEFIINKIEIDGKTYVAPQVLAKLAKEELQKPEKDREKIQDSESSLEDLAEIDGVATLNFISKDSRIAGSSGCGSYFASYRWTNTKTINITPGGQTRKICNPSDVMRFDFRFMRALEGDFIVKQYKNDDLVMSGKSMKIYLKPNK